MLGYAQVGQQSQTAWAPAALTQPTSGGLALVRRLMLRVALPEIDFQDFVGARALRRRDLDHSPFVLPMSARAMGLVIEILPCFTSASNSPTILYHLILGVLVDEASRWRRT